MQSNKESKTSKKIVYVTTVRLPTEKAHGLSTVKICEAFSLCGYEVDLFIPKLWRGDHRDVYDFYNVKRNFDIIRIPCIDLIPLKVFDKITFLIQSFSFSSLLFIFIFFKYWKERNSVIFLSHDYIPLYFSTLLPFKIFYDIHHFPGKNFMYNRVMKRSFGCAVQTKWKIKELVARFSVESEKIIYWPNGTDVSRFDISKTTSETREELGIPLNKKIVMYTGSLFDWKGVDSLIRAIKYLPEDVLIYFVGGTDGDVAACKENIEEASDGRIIFVPFQPFSKIPTWDRSSDVLVLPNTGKQKVSMYYTSPMKLFDYMASGKPIVASSTPAIMEILNSENSVLVEPDNPEELAKGIDLILRNKDLAKRLSSKSLADSKQYTWPERARKITDFFEKHA